MLFKIKCVPILVHRQNLPLFFPFCTYLSIFPESYRIIFIFFKNCFSENCHFHIKVKSIVIFTSTGEWQGISPTGRDQGLVCHHVTCVWTWRVSHQGLASSWSVFRILFRCPIWSGIRPQYIPDVKRRVWSLA